MAASNAEEGMYRRSHGFLNLNQPFPGPALSNPFGPQHNDQVLSPASKDDKLPGSPDSLKQDATAAGEDRSGHEWGISQETRSCGNREKLIDIRCRQNPSVTMGQAEGQRLRDACFT